MATLSYSEGKMENKIEKDKSESVWIVVALRRAVF